VGDEAPQGVGVARSCSRAARHCGVRESKRRTVKGQLDRRGDGCCQSRTAATFRSSPTGRAITWTDVLDKDGQCGAVQPALHGPWREPLLQLGRPRPCGRRRSGRERDTAIGTPPPVFVSFHGLMWKIRVPATVCCGSRRAALSSSAQTLTPFQNARTCSNTGHKGNDGDIEACVNT